MSSRTELLKRQQSWAARLGLGPDAHGYLGEVALNLFKPFSEHAKSDFDKGSGAELVDTPSRLAKMKALHSSSALVVNFFDSWVDRDARRLQTALGLSEKIGSISFEAQYPTGLTGTPPNLDVALALSNGHVVGIESKFSEWLTPKSTAKAPFKDKYFPDGVGLWQSRGLAESQRLAREMYDGAKRFRHLNVPQLLKHALGLATKLGGDFSLYYIYFDWAGPESQVHRTEIDEFVKLVGEELRFKAFTYQELFASLTSASDVDQDYLSYLRTRYFSDVV